MSVLFRNKMEDPADNIIEELESLGVYRTYHMAPVANRLGEYPFDKRSQGSRISPDAINGMNLIEIGDAMSKFGLEVVDIYDSGVVARKKIKPGVEKHYRYHLHPDGSWKGGYSTRDVVGINEIVMVSMSPDEFLTAIGWDIERLEKKY